MLRGVVRSYRRTLQSDRRHLLEEFRLVDVARKVVGVGSVGTRAWILLLFGRDDTTRCSCRPRRRRRRCSRSSSAPADRRRMANGWCTASTSCRRAATSSSAGTTSQGVDGVDRDYYVRQLRDWKGSALVEAMAPPPWRSTAGCAAGRLARAHARSGDRIAIAAYLGGSDAFDQAIAEFSEAYADQNERDYDALVQAEKAGRITARARCLTARATAPTSRGAAAAPGPLGEGIERPGTVTVRDCHWASRKGR